MSVEASLFSSAVEIMSTPVVTVTPGTTIQQAVVLLEEERISGLPVVDQDKCKKCKVCISKFGCPAMYWKGEDVEIDPLLCSGCGVCASKLVCAFKAI